MARAFRLIGTALLLSCSATAFLTRPSVNRELLQQQEDALLPSPPACRYQTKLQMTASEESNDADQLDIVLFGVGDLRTDDSIGLQRALSGENPQKVLPLVILDDTSISKIPGVVSHTWDTANMLIAAVDDLKMSLKEKLGLDLQVVSSTANQEESLLAIVRYYAGSSTKTTIHVHDLGEVDNGMGYGPYSQLRDSSMLPSNVDVVPWTCPLRSQAWTEVASIPDRYPEYALKFSRVPEQPVSLKADGSQAAERVELSSTSKIVPTAEEVVGRLVAALDLDPAVLKSEVNTGMFQSHWGGLDASTVAESKVLENLNTFVNECQEDDELWVQHPRYVGKGCPRNQRSLEHASFNWFLGGTSGGTETNNLLAGEPMTRYLSAPLLLGTVSPRRLWHMAKKECSFFVSPLRTLVEGREWHKLLAAKNIQTRPDYQPLAAAADASVGKTHYGYYRWHGFLCRYAQTPLTTPATGDSSGEEKEGVLFFHGFGASGSQWNKAMGELSGLVAEEPSDGSVMEGLAPDLLGFGHSEKLPISYSIYVWDSQCTDFVKEVAVKRQGWDSFIVGGNSIGGFSAASTAANDYAEVEGSSVCSSGAPGTSKCRGVVLMNSAGPILSREDVQEKEAEAVGDVSKLQSVAQVAATDSLPPCKPPPRPVARFFGNGLLSYLRPRIQSICVNLYPTNPAAVDDNLCESIERDSVDPGAINVMISGAKLPPPRSMNEMLKADYGCAAEDSSVPEVTFEGPVLVAQGVLDPLNDAQGRAEGLEALRDGIEFDAINAGHCPHDELPKEVATSIAKWITSTVKPMKLVGS